MRGPDGKGAFIKPYTALIHRRLSVIDPEKGKQPMQFGKYTIVCITGNLQYRGTAKRTESPWL